MTIINSVSGMFSTASELFWNASLYLSARRMANVTGL